MVMDSIRRSRSFPEVTTPTAVEVTRDRKDRSVEVATEETHMDREVREVTEPEVTDMGKVVVDTVAETRDTAVELIRVAKILKVRALEVRDLMVVQAKGLVEARFHRVPELVRDRTSEIKEALDLKVATPLPVQDRMQEDKAAPVLRVVTLLPAQDRMQEGMDRTKDREEASFLLELTQDKVLVGRVPDRARVQVRELAREVHKAPELTKELEVREALDLQNLA